MKRFMILAILVIFSACGGRPDDDVFIWDENVENPFYGENLSIATRGGRARVDELRMFARQYMAEHPGVTIEIVVFDHDPVIAREQLRVPLMAGQGPDLMDAGIVNLRNRDFFADWMPLIDAHPGFNDYEWFMNAFYTLAEDGKLYAFPEDVGYFYVSGNLNVPGLSDVLAPMETISVEEMLAIYRDF